MVMIMYKEIERSIIKKFRKELYRPFTKAITKYNLIEENDNIMVCISGGKDSFLLAKLIEEIHKHGDKKFTYKCVCMDPGYDDNIIKKIKATAKILNINLTIFKSNIFDFIKTINNKPCYMCARMRRGYLYDEAVKLGCNKIALGHHLDDVIETNLLNLLYASKLRTMLPKIKSDNFPCTLIRPMYMIREKSVISWAKYNGLTFINEACPLDIKKSSSRVKVKELIKTLESENKDFIKSIFNAYENVDLNDIISYTLNDETISNY